MVDDSFKFNEQDEVLYGKQRAIIVGYCYPREDGQHYGIELLDEFEEDCNGTRRKIVLSTHEDNLTLVKAYEEPKTTNSDNEKSKQIEEESKTDA